MAKNRKKRRAKVPPAEGHKPAPLKREWEEFCQLHAKGKLSAAAAYRKVYPKVTSPQVSSAAAGRLLANVKIRRSLDALSRKIASITEEFGPSIERIIKELERIAFSDIREAVTWRAHPVTKDDKPDGGDLLVMLKGSDEINEDVAAAIQSVEQRVTGGLKIKFHDKLPALNLLAQYRGMLGKDHTAAAPLTINQQINNYSPVDRPPPETKEEFILRRQREAVTIKKIA